MPASPHRATAQILVIASGRRRRVIRLQCMYICIYMFCYTRRRTCHSCLEADREICEEIIGPSVGSGFGTLTVPPVVFV